MACSVPRNANDAGLGDASTPVKDGGPLDAGDSGVSNCLDDCGGVNPCADGPEPCGMATYTDCCGNVSTLYCGTCPSGSMCNEEIHQCRANDAGSLDIDGGLDCMQITACIQGCPVGQDCSMECFQAGSDAGYSEFEDVKACFDIACETGPGGPCAELNSTGCISCWNSHASECTSQLNVCDCVPWAPDALCREMLRDCGSATTDNGCGTRVTVNCGGCGANQSCTQWGSCECGAGFADSDAGSCDPVVNGGCGDVVQCWVDDCLALPDGGCQDTCVAEGTQPAQSLFAEVSSCFSTTCEPSEGVCVHGEDCVTCFAAVSADGGECATPYLACATDTSGDLGSDAGGNCVPQTDSELCAQNGFGCAGVSIVDNCGVLRSPSCGTCSANAICSAGFCSCEPAFSEELTDGGGVVCAALMDQNCPDLIRCLDQCTDATCPAECMASATPAAQQSYETWQACLATACPGPDGGVCISSRSCDACIMNADMIFETCNDPYNACIYAANLTCNQLESCSESCEPSDAVCEENCQAEGLPLAQQAFASLETCLDTACPDNDGGICATLDGGACANCRANAESRACSGEEDACRDDAGCFDGCDDVGWPEDGGR